MDPAFDAVGVGDEAPDFEFALDFDGQVAAFVDPFDGIAQAGAAAQVDLVGLQRGEAGDGQAGIGALGGLGGGGGFGGGVGRRGRGGRVCRGRVLHRVGGAHHGHGFGGAVFGRVVFWPVVFWPVVLWCVVFGRVVFGLVVFGLGRDGGAQAARPGRPAAERSAG